VRAAFFEEKSRRTEVSELAVAGSESEPTNAERAAPNECCLGESMNPMPLQISDLVAARRRAAMPSSVPRPLKSVGGRATPIPAHLRVTGVALSDDERVEIRRKLGMRLGKFASSIERVTVRAGDVNGPRGGVDQECSVKVVLSGLPRVVVKRRDAICQPHKAGATVGPHDDELGGCGPGVIHNRLCRRSRHRYRLAIDSETGQQFSKPAPRRRLQIID